MAIEINRGGNSDAGMSSTVPPGPINFPGFLMTEAPAYEDMTRCIHCGLCLQQCPTYRETGHETESPRGRLYLMRAFAEGRVDAESESLHKHLDLCLQCRACETACPSGVRYGHLIEKTLDELGKREENKAKQSRTEKILKFVIFRQLFPYPERLRMFGLATRFYQRTGLQTLTRKLGLLKLPIFSKIGLGNLAELEEMMPAISQPIFAPPLGGSVLPLGEKKYRVALFSGCIMSLAFARVNEATVRVLAHNNCEVAVPDEQICCGALHVHNGDRDYAKEMARRNIEVFERSGELDAIIINAAGCGANLKEYGELLKDDPKFAERAEQFAHKVKDISEFLAGMDFNRNFGRVEKRVTYQDACHLLHAQRVRNPPRILLNAIPGLELIEMRDSDKCCGSAGIYNVTQHDMSMQILDHKMENVAATRASCVATANPGCQLQLQLGVKRANLNEGRKQPVEVVHLVELLDEAYQAGMHPDK